MKLNRRAFLIGSAATAAAIVAAKNLPFEILPKPRLLTERREYVFEMLEDGIARVHLHGDVWWPGIEEGQFSTSFIPTDAFPVHRAADTAYYPAEEDKAFDVVFNTKTKDVTCDRDSPAYYVDSG